MKCRRLGQGPACLHAPARRGASGWRPTCPRASCQCVQCVFFFLPSSAAGRRAPAASRARTRWLTSTQALAGAPVPSLNTHLRVPVSGTMPSASPAGCSRAGAAGRAAQRGARPQRRRREGPAGGAARVPLPQRLPPHSPVYTSTRRCGASDMMRRYSGSCDSSWSSLEYCRGCCRAGREAGRRAGRQPGGEARCMARRGLLPRCSWQQTQAADAGGRGRRGWQAGSPAAHVESLAQSAARVVPAQLAGQVGVQGVLQRGGGGAGRGTSTGCRCWQAAPGGRTPGSWPAPQCIAPARRGAPGKPPPLE